MTTAVGSLFASSLREARTREERQGATRVGGQLLGEDFVHEDQRVVLDALGRADDQHTLAHVRRRLPRDLARGVARHHEDDHLRAVERLGNGNGGADVGRERDAGQVPRVLVGRIDGFAQLFAPRPEDDVVPLLRQELRQRRAPRAGAKHGDLHGAAL